MKIKYIIAKVIKRLRLPAIKNTEIHKTSTIHSGSQINNCQIGKYSIIGSYTNANYTSIGNYCSIADRCVIGGGSHPLDWVSSSPVFYGGRNILKKHFTNKEFIANKETIIKHDVWIGAGALIKSGVTIHTGAVIGMGAVVTKDVGPYEIWGGNPAKLIRKRFDENTIDLLLKSKWWDLEDDQIQVYANSMSDVNEFLGGFDFEDTTLG